MSHHGSRANTSPNFLQLIDCTRFAISTDGSRRHKHPHAEAVARFLVADRQRDKTFSFNYHQPQTERWESALLTHSWNYHCVFPDTRNDAAANGTLAIEI